MKKKLVYFGIATIILFIGSCDDPYNDELDASKLNLGPSQQAEQTELDVWLFDNFVAPYNIEVKYRWDGAELDVNKTLVPPTPDRVESIMNVVRDAWIEPYTKEAGEVFLKTYAPKQFVLVGSAEYNPGGTITLGTAEGGRKIVLYVINHFEDTDRAKIKEQMHTVHHEFAHILHQNILYPAEFKTITSGGYTADWHNITKAEAQSRGFITSYAMSAPDEDFVEMIATMLTEGKRGFDRIVCAIPNEEAQAFIRRKEQFVVNYYSDVYNIDFYQLQQRTDAAIDSYAPKSLLADLGLGSAHNFYIIRINPAELPPLPADFQDIYDQVVAGVPAATDGEVTLEFMELLFGGNGDFVLRFWFTDGENSYAASLLYTLAVSPDDIVTLTYVEQNSNAQYIRGGIQPMVDYFENNTFLFDWVNNDSEDCVSDYGGIFPQELPASYDAFGILAN